MSDGPSKSSCSTSGRSARRRSDAPLCESSETPSSARGPDTTGCGSETRRSSAGPAVGRWRGGGRGAGARVRGGAWRGGAGGGGGGGGRGGAGRGRGGGGRSGGGGAARAGARGGGGGRGGVRGGPPGGRAPMPRSR